MSALLNFFGVWRYTTLRGRRYRFNGKQLQVLQPDRFGEWDWVKP